MTRAIPATPFVWAAAVGLLVVTAVYPIAKVAVEAVTRGGSAGLGNFAAALGDERNVLALRHSLEVALSSTVIATAIGAFLAWLVARTDLPGRRFFRTAFVLPFLIPPFVGAIAWLYILGPVGYLNRLWMTITGSSEPLFVVYGYAGIVLVLVLHDIPLVYLTVLGGLERMNPELEEAAQISGSGTWRVMRTITLPLMVPVLLAAAVLTFTSDIAEFGIPAVLGFSQGYFVLPVKIYEQIARGFAADSIGLAAALAVVLMSTGALALLVQRWLLRGDRAQRYVVISGKSMQPSRVRLGTARWWLFALCLTLVLATTVMPVAAVALTSLIRSVGLSPAPENWSLRHFEAVLTGLPAATRGIRNSLILAVSAATIVAVLGALIAYLIVRTRLRGRALLDVSASLPYAIPGTVFALGVILAWLRPFPGVAFTLYNTLWIILVAYVGRYMIFGVRPTAASLAQVHTSLEEAARVSGAGWLRTFRDIVLPLVLPGIFAAWFLVFIPTLRELTVSILLWSAGNETIGVMVFNLQESGQEGPGAALALVMIGLLVAANYAARWLSRGRVGY